MSETEEKLLEAEYFLNHMIENQTERYAFRYGLSAFLTAFRSVMDMMKSEFKEYKPLGFKQWWRKIYKEKIENDQDMDFLIKGRNYNIHQKSIQPHAQISVGIREHLSLNASISAVVIRAGEIISQPDSKPPTPLPTHTEETADIEYKWYFEAVPNAGGYIPRDDVITLSQNSLNKLKDIVLSCGKEFTKAKLEELRSKPPSLPSWL